MMTNSNIYLWKLMVLLIIDIIIFYWWPLMTIIGPLMILMADINVRRIIQASMTRIDLFHLPFALYIIRR